MVKCIRLTRMSLVLAMAALIWIAGPGWAQTGNEVQDQPKNQTEAMDQAAANRAAVGMQRSVTHTQRKAAAERAKAARAAEAQKNQNTAAGQGEVTK